MEPHPSLWKLQSHGKFPSSILVLKLCYILRNIWETIKIVDAQAYPYPSNQKIQRCAPGMEQSKTFPGDFTEQSGLNISACTPTQTMVQGLQPQHHLGAWWICRISSPAQGCSSGDWEAPVRSDSLCVCLCVAQLCLTLHSPIDWIPPGFSVHGILQTRILEWIAITSSRKSSWTRDQTHISCISCIGRRILGKNHLGSPSSIYSATIPRVPTLSCFLEYSRESTPLLPQRSTL